MKKVIALMAVTLMTTAAYADAPRRGADQGDRAVAVNSNEASDRRGARGGAQEGRSTGSTVTSSANGQTITVTQTGSHIEFEVINISD